MANHSQISPVNISGESSEPHVFVGVHPRNLRRGQQGTQHNVGITTPDDIEGRGYVGVKQMKLPLRKTTNGNDIFHPRT